MKLRITLLIKTLKIISLILIIVSATYFIVSITEITKTEFSKLSFASIYSFLSTHSGLYKFTFIVCAFWVTLQQLELSQNNYTKTLNQIKFTQDDIELKRKRETSTDTLKQCNFYLEEMQIAYKELIETHIMSGMPIDWKFLKILTNESLKEKYINAHTKFDQVERSTKNEVLIVLYKLESFSSLFIHGNLDNNFAQEIIGYTYLKQVGFLLGLIAYFREDSNSKFGKNIITLFNKWKVDSDE